MLSEMKQSSHVTMKSAFLVILEILSPLFSTSPSLCHYYWTHTFPSLFIVYIIMKIKFMLHHILAKLAVNLSLKDVSTSSRCLISAVKSQSKCVNCGDILYPYLHSQNLPLLHWPWLVSLCCNYVCFPVQWWKHLFSSDSSVEWRCRGLLMQEAAIDECCRARLLI